MPVINSLTSQAVVGAKGASYFEGSEVNGDPSYQLVKFNPGGATIGDETLDFFPHYTAPVNIAYRLYKWNLSGYSGPSTFYLDWLTLPQGDAVYYLSILNQQTHIFDSYQGTQSGLIVVPGFEPYVDMHGNMIFGVLAYATSGSPGVPAGQLEQITVGGTAKLAVGGFRYLPESVTPGMPPYLVSNGMLPPACDLEDHLPPCGNQGAIGACSQWAVVSGALNLELDAVYGPLGRLVSDPSFLPSVRYATVEGYYLLNLPFEDNQAAPFAQVNAMLYNYGVPSESDRPWNYPDISFWDRQYDFDPSDKANLIDIENYWQFAMSEGGMPVLDSIKKVVALHSRGVMLAINVNILGPPGDANNMENPWLWNGDFPYFPSGHAVCVVGYSDAAQALKVRNSWGNGGVQRGYFWMSYDNFDAVHFYGAIGGAQVYVEDYNPRTEQVYLGTQVVNPPPQQFRASNYLPDKVAITWDSLPGVSEYVIYRDTTATEFIHYYPANPSADYQIVYDNSPALGATHTYWIKAKFLGGILDGRLSRPVYGWATGS